MLEKLCFVVARSYMSFENAYRSRESPDQRRLCVYAFSLCLQHRVSPSIAEHFDEAYHVHIFPRNHIMIANHCTHFFLLSNLFNASALGYSNSRPSQRKPNTIPTDAGRRSAPT